MKTRQSIFIWTLGGVSDGGHGYVDYNMYRHPYHDVTLTMNTETGGWYSSTRISPVKHGTDAPFGEPRELPDAMTIKLRNLMEAIK